MSLIERIHPYQLLFAACVGVTYLNNYELTFAVWTLTLLFTIKQKYSVTILKFCACFAAIYAIATVSAFFNEHTGYNYFRDASYLVKPVLGLLIGYQLCKNDKFRALETVVYTGLLIAIIHLSIIFYSVVAYRIINIHVLREFGGYFSDFEVYAILLLIFAKEFELQFTQKGRWLLLLLIGFSMFLYLSRTNFLQLIIIYFALKGYFRPTPRTFKTMGSLILITLIGYTIIYNMHLERDGKGIEAFLYKIKNAPIEAFKTKINEDDYEDFNDNYRSFENIITVRQVSNEGFWGVLFGKGMGATVDVGREMWTNDGEYIRYVPTLHNGFMTVFLKAGLLGIVFNLLFIILLCRPRKPVDSLTQNLNLMLIGTGVFLILANWVLLGLYLKIDNKSILIGYFLCYVETLRKKHKLSNVETV